MNLRSRLLAPGALAALALAAGAAPAPAQERTPSLPPSSSDEPSGKAGTPQDTAPAAPPRLPSGMVRFPGGKVRIGIGAKDLEEVIAGTELGRQVRRMIEDAIRDELMPSTPEWTAEVPAFWIGKYEVTNAQYHRFLEEAGKTTVTVPAAGAPGARTLEEIARQFLLATPYRVEGGGLFHPVVVDWKGLYELNEEVLNPPGPDGKRKAEPDSFRKRILPPGTVVTAYRYSVPGTWRVNSKLRGAPPQGKEGVAVTGVSLADALAFAEHYGCHIPTEVEWEAACRGPAGTLWPEGKAFDPLGHAWKGFNDALEKAKGEAKRKIDGTRKALETARAAGQVPPALQAEADRLEWVLRASPLPDVTGLDSPVYEVGSFPAGRWPGGPLDMIGNADEWVSTRLFPYPGMDGGSKAYSKYFAYDAYMFRGCNVIDKDTLLQATFRKFVIKGAVLGKTFRQPYGGFRVARLEAPGISAAFHTAVEAEEADPPILPREVDRKTREVVGPGLNAYGGVGIERLDEVAWDPARSPGEDPSGKVFYRGRAESVAVLPATGMPFGGTDGLRKAAEDKAPPAEGKDGKGIDRREPRQIPFLGILHLTGGMEIKGELLTEVREKVPLTPEEIAAIRRQIEERRKKKEEAEKGPAEKKDGEGGGEPKPPEDGKQPDDRKMEGKPEGKGGKGGGKPDDKGGQPPAEGGDPAAKPEGEGEGEEEAEEEEKVPTHREVTRFEYKPGFLRGKDYPNGLFLGYLRHGEEPRAVLWEARRGLVGSSAPGGHVLLEKPLLVLEKGALSFKRAAKVLSPYSVFDKESGEVKFLFYVPMEGKSEAFEFNLKIFLREFPAETAECRWNSVATLGAALSSKPKPVEKK